MTKQQAEKGPSSRQEGDGDVVAVYETVEVQERLVRRTCGWCGVPITYSGVGRPARYCSPAHRQRASELRRAQAHADRPTEEGGRSTEPVQEVVERTERITRTVVRQGPVEIRRVPATRLSGQPYTLPEDATEWAAALRALRSAATAGLFRQADCEALARGCEVAADELRIAAGRPSNG